MSFRVNIVPAMPNPETADLTIPADVTPGQVEAVADACRMTPLRIFAPSREDWRLWRLMERLESEYGWTLEHYEVYLSEEPGVASDRWTQL
jgi:hypothetical protein